MRIFGVLRMAPWWRGPLLLLRRAGVAVALIAAAAVATLPASAATPFLSSSRDATLHHQIAAACPWSLGVTIDSNLSFADPSAEYPDGVTPTSGADTVARRTREGSAAAAALPLLGPAETTLITTVTGQRPDRERPAHPGRDGARRLTGPT